MAIYFYASLCAYYMCALLQDEIYHLKLLFATRNNLRLIALW